MTRIKIDGKYRKFEGDIMSFMLSIGKNPDSYIYTVGGKPVPMDCVPDGDVIAINVASRG